MEDLDFDECFVCRNVCDPEGAAVWPLSVCVHTQCESSCVDPDSSKQLRIDELMHFGVLQGFAFTSAYPSQTFAS